MDNPMPLVSKTTLVETLLRVIAASFEGFAPQFKLTPKWAINGLQQWVSGLGFSPQYWMRVYTLIAANSRLVPGAPGYREAASPFIASNLIALDLSTSASTGPGSVPPRSAPVLSPLISLWAPASSAHRRRLRLCEVDHTRSSPEERTKPRAANSLLA